MQQRKAGNGLSPEIRRLAVDEIKASGALEYAKSVVVGLQETVDKTLTLFEERMGAKNWILRLVQKRLEL